MKIILDRFEGEYAVIELEDGGFVNAPKELFCDGSEGDVYSITKDEHETKKRKKHNNALRRRLLYKDSE